MDYATHSKTYRFYVIEQNNYISIHSIIESRNETLMRIDSLQ